jgi:hypothetical protein
MSLISAQTELKRTLMQTVDENSYASRDQNFLVRLVRDSFLNPMFEGPFTKVFDHFTRDLLRDKAISCLDLIEYTSMMRMEECEISSILDLYVLYYAGVNRSLIILKHMNAHVFN